MKRVLPNGKKFKQSMPSIKVDGNLKTDKNVIAEGFNHFFTDPNCQDHQRQIGSAKIVRDILPTTAITVQEYLSYFYKGKLRAKFSKT